MSNGWQCSARPPTREVNGLFHHLLGSTQGVLESGLEFRLKTDYPLWRYLSERFYLFHR